jgi:uncharacterized protein YciI
MPRFIFFYTMTEDKARIRDTVPAHVAYWQECGLDSFQGGPFADRTGGLITFAARDLTEATAAADGDPFVTAGVLGDRWVKEWLT